MRGRAIIAILTTSLLAAAASAATAPEAVRAEAREILRTAVGIDNAAGQGNVPKLAEYLAGKLRDGGFAPADIHIVPFGETASLVARYPGDGSGGKPILLLAHLDVVPARRSDWQRDPFTLVEEGGYFFGRGTYDVKGEVAALVATLVGLKHDGFVPTRDVVLVFSGDEETAQATAQDLVDHHRDLVDAELAINSDGGGGLLDDATGAAHVFYLQGAEKTSATYELVTRNPGGHSSEPRDDNAIYDLAKALDKLAAFRFPVQWNDWTLGSFRETGKVTAGDVGQAMRRFAADPHDAAAAELLFHQPTYVGRTRTTCVATMLAAGHAENALPQSADATVNCRIFPGTTPQAVRDTLAKLVGEGVEVKLDDDPQGAPASPLRQDVVDAATKAVHASYPGVPIVPDMAPYATDGKIFRAAGIPTYGASGIFLKPKDDFAHGLNERIPVAAFDADLVHWSVLVRALAGKS